MVLWSPLPRSSDEAPHRREREPDRDRLAALHTTRSLGDPVGALRLAHTLRHLDNLQRALGGRQSHYDPNQPRVPAGHSDGGQWTRLGASAPSDDPIVATDAAPDDEWKPSARYAMRRPGRGPVSVRIRGRIVDVEPGQAARLAEAQARAHDALTRVREIDPQWRPGPSEFDTVEGLIVTYHAEAREAEARIAELARIGIGPGPFARESLPARGPGRRFRAWERDEGNRIFRETGCHTCGTFEPGTPLGNCVLDHQLPTVWNPPGRSQRLYPQCTYCSARQGNWLSRNKR
jgi:hypothetical protein